MDSLLLAFLLALVSLLYATVGQAGLAALTEGKSEAKSALPPPELRLALGYEDYDARAKRFVLRA